jgi:hypothetical protein
MTNHEAFLKGVSDEFQDKELTDMCRRKFGNRELTEDEQRKLLLETIEELVKIVELRAMTNRIRGRIPIL